MYNLLRYEDFEMTLSHTFDQMQLIDYICLNVQERVILKSS